MKNNANCNALYLSTTNWSYLIRVMHLPCFPHFPGCNTKSSCSFNFDDLPSLFLKLGIIFYFSPFVSALCIRIIGNIIRIIYNYWRMKILNGFYEYFVYKNNVYLNVLYKKIFCLDNGSHQFLSNSGTKSSYLWLLHLLLYESNIVRF